MALDTRNDWMNTGQHKKFFNSNSKLFRKPQDNDYTFLPAEMVRITRILPLGERLLVKLIDDTPKGSVIAPSLYTRPMWSKVIAIGTDVKGSFSIGQKVLHQHRCGLQIGFFGSDIKYRILPERFILATLVK